MDAAKPAWFESTERYIAMARERSRVILDEVETFVDDVYELFE
jgi:hypothetical protein